jgi:hypothetical protein
MPLGETTYPYYTLNILLEEIPEPLQGKLLLLWDENFELFSNARGSSHNHQTWEGGYLDHVREVMNIACVLYRTLNHLRPLPFKLADVLTVLFLHDVEKPWKAELHFTKSERPAFRQKLIEKYGIVLTEEQQIAFKYVEGENDDYSPEHRVTNEMGAFCHMCDYASARLWYDRPLMDGETWGERSCI